MRLTKSIVPNLFTLVNLFMGFSALVHIADGNYRKAAFLILIAGVFDMLDGVVARFLKATSEFGVELDSLCDAVSFGIVPSFMLYNVYFYQFNEIGILLASFPALAGVSRLARFNIQTVSFEDKQYFTGLPIPSGAFLIISYIVFFHLPGSVPDYLMHTGILTITLGTSLVMISKIKFLNIPRPTKKSIKEKPIIFTIFVIGLIASLISKGLLVFPFILFYVLGSIIMHFYKLFIRYQTENDLIE